jgi:hypothetical protein
MHILTGMLLSLLIGKKSPRSGETLPSFHGIIELRHHLPGRMRVYVQKLVGDSGLKERFEEQVSALGEKIQAEASTVSGTILVKYDTKVIEPPIMFALLIRLLGLEEEVQRTPTSHLTQGLRRGVEALNRGIYDYSRGVVDLWSLVPLMLLGIGTFRLVTSKQNRFPASFTLLWWAYTFLLRGGNK